MINEWAIVFNAEKKNKQKTSQWCASTLCEEGMI